MRAKTSRTLKTEYTFNRYIKKYEPSSPVGSTTVVEMHNELRDTPKTGDNSKLGLWLALAGVSVAGIAACGIIGFKKKKKEDREAKVAEVLHFLCKAKRIQLFVIRQKDPIALATEIKQAFAKANLFINSDSQRDVAHLRKRYFAQKNNGN